MENDQLTIEEMAIWKTLSQGHTYKEISEKLGITLNSVQSGLKHIYSKISVRNRAEAAIKFIKQQQDTNSETID